MRQIILDTETTGLDPQQGHRIIEIGCLELIDRQLTGKNFHIYLNPEREIDEAAIKVHGITLSFLADKPLFKDIADDFLAFIQHAELIIHNAPFDIGFIKAELSRMKSSVNLNKHCKVLDTLALAKQKHPGQKNNLDALCKRYSVNNSNRELHGALLDAELLAYVFLAMTGGQMDMFSHQENTKAPEKNIEIKKMTPAQAKTKVVYASAEELAKDQLFWEQFAD